MQDAMLGSSLILGPRLAAFEEQFALAAGAQHCVGVGNGLDALRIALESVGIGQGDEVIVPAHTFFATWLAVIQTGATPVGVDVCADSFNIDPTLIERAITKKTKAIVPVHLYGRPAEMDAVLDLAQDRELVVIEDAAQAHGATYKGKPVGGLGLASGFSFYPTKNLGALGDGGAITTNSSDLADFCRTLRNYGSREKYFHESVGYNSRLDEIQASVLSVKMKWLASQNKRRCELAERYNEGLSGVSGITTPKFDTDCASVWHLYVLRLSQREIVREYLQERGVATLIHYPVPPHLQSAVSYLGYEPGSFPVSEMLAREILSLPFWPDMEREQQDYVIQALRDCPCRR